MRNIKKKIVTSFFHTFFDFNLIYHRFLGTKSVMRTTGKQKDEMLQLESVNLVKLVLLRKTK